MKIGIFTPSSAVSPQKLEKCRLCAQKMGHQLVFANDPAAHYASTRYLFSADSREGRISALKQLLDDSSLDLIMAARGGYGALELVNDLSSLRSEMLKKRRSRPIFLSGLSDFTILLLTLDNIPDVHMLHGPGFVDAFFDYENNSERRKSTDALLSLAANSWKGYADLHLQQLSGSALTEPLEVSFLGGNLSVLTSLLGSFPVENFASRGLFIEEISEKPYKLHRALLQLKNAGALDKLKVLLLGDFYNCQHENGVGPNVDDVIKDIFKEFAYPVLKAYPGGHLACNLPLPLGVKLSLTIDSLTPL